MAVRIHCINKDGGNHYNPHEGITYCGWVADDGSTGKSSRAEMIEFLEVKKGTAYVQDSRGNRAYIGVWVSAAGNKYLRTYADRVWTDNLLSLPECR